jgi:hypothetical protein
MDRRWMNIVAIGVVTCVSLATRAEALTGPINVTALPAPCTSAIPSDSVDDQPAIQCAINNILPATGGELFFPAGWYFLNNAITIANKSVQLRGAGMRMTRLLYNGGTNNGITFTSNSSPNNHTFAVKSMSLNRYSGAGGNAIYAAWQTPSWQGSFGGTSATIFDVYIDGITPGTRWDNGIWLHNAVGARIYSFTIHGDPVWQSGVGTAILVTGRSIGVSINDGNMGRWTNGIYVGDTSEAVEIEDVEGSEHHYAFRFETTGKGHVISHSHCSFTLNRAVLVVNSSDVAVTDNLWYVADFANGYIGIEIRNPSVAGSGFRIRGNQMAAAGDGSHDGIVLDGMISDSVVSGNMTAGMLRGVWLKPGVSNSIVVGNVNRDPAVGPLDQGTNNLVSDNPVF